MTARVLAGVLALALLASPLAPEAQPAGKVYRIGVLYPGSPPHSSLSGAFYQGLRELGYIEGQNISIEERWAEGRPERLPDLAADLVRRKVDVIVAEGLVAWAAKQATTTIPIVLSVSNDPVGAGLVASLARPGGNVTGLAFLSEELGGKWMELLKETFPGISRVAVLWHPASAGQGQLRTSEAAARSLGVRFQALKVERSDELDTAFAEAHKNRAGALIVSSSAFFYQNRTRLVGLAAKHRLPTMYHQKDFVVGSGGLMSYGPNLHEVFRRAATFVDKILKGAKPADLPVEQPTKFELVINLRTARALGLTIPPSMLARADEVIQ
ncbi:MAG TPA: ABC transporter substrate-binding protein [Methylomirabilota bacterium]|nr:ABC transporter substrate-binding protein [Methylomirabilota bacterium]